MKIQFKQQGGVMPPYITYTPFIPTGNSSTYNESYAKSSNVSSRSDSNSGELKDKDLLTMLKDIDGLPNDMNVVVKNLKNMYDLQMLTGDNSQNLVSLYLSTLLKSKSVTFNKKQFDDAFNEVKSNGGLSETAITEDGKIVVYDEKSGMKAINVDTYLKSPQKYRRLTNSNILYMRSHYPQLAFRNEMLSIVENGIGMEKVAKLLKENLLSIGSSKSDITYNIFKENGQVTQGADVLKMLQEQGYGDNTSIDGLYEAKIITETQAKQAEAALKYLYTILPDNAKTLLKLKAGGSKGLTQTLYNLINSNVSSSMSMNLTYKGAYDKTGKDKNSTSSGNTTDDVKLNIAAQTVLGLGQDSMFVIQDGTSEGLPVYSTEMPLTKGNDRMGRTTLLNATTSDLSGNLDFTNVTIGGMPVDPSSLGYVMIDGNVHSIDMVIDKDARQNGIIRPDFKALKRKEQADKEIQRSYINHKDYNKVNEVYRKYNLPWIYQSDGKLNTTDYSRFAVFNSVVTSRAFDEKIRDRADFNDYLKELGKTDTNNAVEQFKHINDKFKYSEPGIFSSGDILYKGTVYIPMNSNILNSLNTNLTPTQALSIDQRSRNQQQTSNKPIKWNNPNEQ